MTAEESRAEQMQPYRALFAAIIFRAIEDIKYGGACDRSQAAHWLLNSEVSAGLLDLLDIDSDWFRERLKRQPWFARAYRESRLLNPLLAA